MQAFQTEVRIKGDEGREYIIAPRAEIKGAGGFAEVRVARCAATGEAVAVKIIQLRPVGKMDERTVLREVRIQRQAGSAPHLNVLRVLDVHVARGDTPADLTRHSPLGPAGTAYIVLELCTGGELFDRLTDFGRVPEPNASAYLRGLLEGVRHLHSRGVIHRDIKLENVLLMEDGTVKLVDFGLAAELAVNADGAPLNVNALLRDVVGSQSYVAPEVRSAALSRPPLAAIARRALLAFRARACSAPQPAPRCPRPPFPPSPQVLVRKKGYAGPPVDAWSCGVCLFTLLSGFFPLDVADARDWRFRRLQAEQALGNLKACQTIFAMYQRECPFSDAAQELLDGLLRVDPTQRLTIEGALGSAWLQPEGKDEHGAFEGGVDGEGVVYRSVLFGSFTAPSAPLSPEMLVPKRQAAHHESVMCVEPRSRGARALVSAVTERLGGLGRLSGGKLAASVVMVAAALAIGALAASRAAKR